MSLMQVFICDLYISCTNSYIITLFYLKYKLNNMSDSTWSIGILHKFLYKQSIKFPLYCILLHVCTCIHCTTIYLGFMLEHWSSPFEIQHVLQYLSKVHSPPPPEGTGSNKPWLDIKISQCKSCQDKFTYSKGCHYLFFWNFKVQTAQWYWVWYSLCWIMMKASQVYVKCSMIEKHWSMYHLHQHSSNHSIWRPWAGLRIKKDMDVGIKCKSLISMCNDEDGNQNWWVYN